MRSIQEHTETYKENERKHTHMQTHIQAQTSTETPIFKQTGIHKEKYTMK